MRVTRRTFTFLIFAIPLFFLSLLAYYVVSSSFKSAQRDLAPILSAELSRATGHDVRVRRVRIEGGYAYLDDVSVVRKQPFGDQRIRHLASARQVSLDFDLQSLLFEKNPRVPLFANVHVLDPIAYVARDSTGRWNFSDLFKPRKVKPARPSVGTVAISNGFVTYYDSKPPNHKDRTDGSLAAAFSRVTCNLQFNSDDAVTWSASGVETTGLGNSAAVVGSYEPGSNRLYLRIDAGRARLAALNRFLPRGQEITNGNASGRLTLLRYGDKPFEYLLDARLDSLAASTDRLNAPVADVQGSVTATPDLISGKLSGGFAGSAIEVDGHVEGFKKPEVAGFVRGTGLQLQRIAAVVKLPKKYRDLQQIAAQGSTEFEVAGNLDKPYVDGRADLQVSGELPRGFVLPTPSSLSVRFSGTAAKPRIAAVGRAPVVRYRNRVARDVFVSAAVDGNFGAAHVHAVIASGRAEGQVVVQEIDKKLNYSAVIRARGVNLADIPNLPADRVSGVASADAVISGDDRGGTPQGWLIVQANSLNFNNYSVQEVSGLLHTTGDIVHLDALAAADATGFAVASGAIDLNAKTLDLNIEADEVNLAKLPIEPRADGSPTIEGLGYLRQGHVSGRWEDPQFSGLVRAYEVGSGDRLRLDFVAANVEGSRSEIGISNGQAWRFPAFTTVRGIVHRPFSPRAQIEVEGSFDELELQDLAELAGTDVKASGTGRGSWVAQGYLRRPVVHAPDISIRRPAFGDFAFDRMSGSIEYEAGASPELRVTNVIARNRSVIVTGNVDSYADRHFEARIGTENVDLSLLDPYLGGNANLTGRGSLRAAISGVVENGNVDRLGGQVTGSTASLMINGESFGELSGLLTLDGDKIRSTAIALGTANDGVRIDRLEYDRKTEGLNARGSAAGIPLERLRQALIKSGFVTNDPDGWLSARLRPIQNPFTGQFGGDFTVMGSREKPAVELSWHGDQMVVADQKIDSFKGSAFASKDRIDLHRAEVTAGSTVVTAQGTYVPDKQLEGEADINYLPLSVLKRWFPDSSLLFKPVDLTRPVDLGLRLRDAQDPLSVYLRSRFSQAALDRLNEVREGSAPADVQQQIVVELNRIVRQGESIYTPQRFGGIALSPETRKLADGKPSGRGIARLNRLLLMEAYSRELRQGIPDRPMLEGLDGMADKVTVTSTGSPSAPNLVVTADLSHASWTDPDGQILSGRPIAFERVLTSPISIGNGRVTAGDVILKVADSSPTRGGSAGAPAGQAPASGTPVENPGERRKPAATELAAVVGQRTPAGPYELHLKDVSLPFSWAALGLRPDENARFKLLVDEQGLGLIAAFTTTAPQILDGTFSSSLQFEGPL